MHNYVHQIIILRLNTVGPYVSDRLCLWIGKYFYFFQCVDVGLQYMYYNVIESMIQCLVIIPR